MTVSIRDKLSFEMDDEVLEHASKLLDPDVLSDIEDISRVLVFSPIEASQQIRNVVSIRQLRLKRAIAGRQFEVEPNVRSRPLQRADRENPDLAIDLNVIIGREALSGVVKLEDSEQARQYASRLRIPSAVLNTPILTRRALDTIVDLYNVTDGNRRVTARYDVGMQDEIY